MNLEYYKNFVEIVDSGNFSTASRKLMIAQPALSNQVKTLEALYNTRLLIRNARSVDLTDEGRILYNRSKSILTLLDTTQKEIASCVQGRKGTLWLGMSPALPDAYITNLLLAFNRQYPEITYELFEVNAAQLVELLNNGIIEVGIIRASGSDYPTLSSALTLSEQMIAVYPRENPWLAPGLKKIPISMLKDVPLSISKGFRKILTNAFVKEGLTPNFFCVSTTRVATLMWMEAGVAVAVVPSSLRYDYGKEGYCCCPVGDAPLSIDRSFAYLKGRKLSVMAETFLEFSKNMFSEINGLEQCDL